MKIWVEHEVSNHPYSCLYSDGTFMEGRNAHPITNRSVSCSIHGLKSRTKSALSAGTAPGKIARVDE